MFDDVILDRFIEDQLRLFPKEVVYTREEAEAFLEDMMAVVLEGKDEVIAYFEEEGLDLEDGDILNASEVFDIGDGRYLVVEA